MRLGLQLPPTTGPQAASPHSLLARLEPPLGLTTPSIPAALRTARLLPRLTTTAGYWSASAAVDPWSTATRLLRDRDALTLHGWPGESISPSLDALFALTVDLPPSPGERFAAIADAIGSRPVDLPHLHLVDPRAHWPGAIQRVFEKLEAHGTQILETPPSPAPATGDLLAARTPALSPVADGSLQLVRAQGTGAAAEDLAAWLATQPDLDDTLVVSPDATLDAALHRAGVPTTGSDTTAAPSAALQVIPLVLQLLASPPDPQAALDLLCLPRCPIPRRLARKLADALRQWPAVGSEPWTEAIEAFVRGDDLVGHAEPPAPEALARQRDRATTLLTPTLPHAAAEIPIAEIRRRLDALAPWIRGLAHAPDDAADPHAWRGAQAQLQTLRQLLDAHDTDAIAPPLLDRLVDAATASAGAASPYPAEAGLRTVAAPGGVVEAVDTIVWWNFTRDVAPPIRELALTGAQRQALADRGISIPSAADRASWQAARWRRPLTMARRRLVLVAPLTSAPGEAVHPHPLWDEIVAAIPEDERSRGASSLTVVRPGMLGDTEVPRRTAAPLGLPVPARRFSTAPSVLAPRETMSPSSLGRLVACSLSWALRYPLKVRERASYKLEVGAREVGSLAHDVLARVFAQSPRDEPEATALASAAFEEIGPVRLAPWWRPGADAARENHRLMIVQAAAAVVQWLSAQGLSAAKVEQRLQRPLFGGELAGRVDLLAVADDAPDRRVVVDYKLGRRDDRIAEIASGTAHQLAAYAWLAAADGGAMPEFAFFILRDALLVGRRGGPFADEHVVDGSTPAQVWALMQRACEVRLAELAEGALHAPFPDDPDRKDKPGVDGDRLWLPPQCQWCDFDAMCGRAFADPRGS